MIETLNVILRFAFFMVGIPTAIFTALLVRDYYKRESRE